MERKLKDVKANMNKITFEYEYVEKMEEVRKHIQECEDRHTQQAIYSTFHDALTQVCFGCKKVRSTIKRY